MKSILNIKDSPHLMETSELCLSYDGKTVLCEVSFHVDNGDYLCIVGENGSGKSTLVKALLGLKAPTSGIVSIGKGLKQAEIGYLPQQTKIQKDFPASVSEVVMSGCLGSKGLLPFYTSADRKKAAECMEKLGITSLKSRCYRELSGGQQQRVLLARALCATGKLLLLDEPVAGLDPIVTKDMYSTIEKLNKEDGITVIMVSHDLDAALKYSTKILHIGHTVQFFGKTEDYLASSAYKKITGGRENA